jgi:hypothetical protein
MARIRTIKPDFFLDPDLAPRLPVMTRLLFIGLWTLADRDGRLEDCPIRIAAQIFPYDPCDIEGMLADLSTLISGRNKRLIDRFEASNGRRYIQIVNFEKHQRPHIREVVSSIEKPSTKHKRHNLERAEALPGFSDRKPRKVRSPLDKGKGMDTGEGKEIAAAPPEISISKPTLKTFTPDQQIVRAFKEAKDINADDADWDKLHYKRFARAAADLRKIFAGRTNDAIAYVLAKGQELDDRGLLGWGLEAIARAAATDPRALGGEPSGPEDGAVATNRLAGP